MLAVPGLILITTITAVVVKWATAWLLIQRKLHTWGRVAKRSY